MLKIVGLLHHAVRIDGSAEGVAEARRFYGELLGLPLDGGRPDIPDTPGWWFNVPDRPVEHSGAVQERPQGPPPVALRQIHLIGTQQSAPSAAPAEAPNVGQRDHVAFAVADLQEAKHELERNGVVYLTQTRAVGAEQVFFQDPFGNVIELQEAR